MEAIAKRPYCALNSGTEIFVFALLLTLGRSKWLDSKALHYRQHIHGSQLFPAELWRRMDTRPIAGKGRIRPASLLLVLKIILFLGLFTTLFFRFQLDAISFALGFSTLILAILIESVLKAMKLET